MSKTDETDEKKPLKLSRPGKLELKKTVESGQVKQNFSHGRSKMVTVEVKKKRTYAQDATGKMSEVQEKNQPALKAKPAATKAKKAAAEAKKEIAALEADTKKTLTEEEKAARARALDEARKREEEAQAEMERLAAEEAAKAAEPAPESEPAAAPAPAADEPVEAEGDSGDADEADEPEIDAAPEPKKTPVRGPEMPAWREEKLMASTGHAPKHKKDKEHDHGTTAERDEVEARGKKAKAEKKTAGHAPARPRGEPRRRSGKLTIAEALDGGEKERTRSLASVRRAREKEKQKHREALQEGKKIVREVTVPETITVQELANRMSERGAAVVKELMKLGVMVTINQTIDADTAELVTQELGHRVKRVSEADVELGLAGVEDSEKDLKPRAPVVTVMGHVDHGKTSLLDALRATDVVAGEAGGITQHIGAYQVEIASGDKITFIDTPGHAAFTEMRSRGAQVTDIVVLVVAADDGIMPQTVEAIHHAQAAKVPIIVAINKMDKPEADPNRVRTELLQHNLQVEEMGGDILSVEVSAMKKTGLDKLEEAILLQAELLDLRANPNRPGEGVVVEARMEQGRGSVATVLIQRGKLSQGDIFVAGSEWGRVRALVDSHGEQVESSGPGEPVEVLGLQGTPSAGDEVVVVDSENRAREVSEYRQRKQRDAKHAAGARGSLEQMFDRIKQGEQKELPVLIKADVHGSVEAIQASLEKMATDEVKVTVLHSAVGGINESDVTLARASGALIIGFNVRANPQARELAKRDNVEIRYYSIIYDVTDDAKKLLSGMMAPDLRENFLGYAEVREVFSITKVGKVAGCMVTDGVVKRGAKVRLLRDDVVIHEGALSQLKRFKDDAKEVKEGYECGMAFENYQDIQSGDMIECFEVEEVARAL